LMGNWSEERALQFATGEARYPVSIWLWIVDWSVCVHLELQLCWNCLILIMKVFLAHSTYTQTKDPKFMNSFNRVICHQDNKVSINAIACTLIYLIGISDQSSFLLCTHPCPLFIHLSSFFSPSIFSTFEFSYLYSIKG
jgi:hypothetical protein